jgi:tetratricopeptide (TPR) repeat protein
MFQSYQMLGAAAHARGSLDDAEPWYQNAVAIAQELDDKNALLQVCFPLGQMALDRDEWDESGQWYCRAIGIATELGNRMGIVLAYAQLGQLATARGELADALEWTVRATDLLHQGSHPDNGGPYQQLAKLVDRMGWPAVKECWQRVIGTPLPADVRRIIAAHQEDG